MFHAPGSKFYHLLGADAGDAASFARLANRIADLETQLAAREAELAHARKTFAHASIAARIGVWECNLADNALTWTDLVYDMFDLPRGSVVDRETTVHAYSPESAARLAVLRTAAIADLGSFTLDAEIVTHRGTRRVIRVTASVEAENGVAVRLFGMKQDITDERAMLDRMRYMATHDAMTGLANRAQFQSRLADAGRPLGGLLLLDLDGFKQINDTHGHLAGDACLRAVAARLSTVCAGMDMVARIGGDELAVVLPPSVDIADVTAMAATIVGASGDPIAFGGGTLSMSASIGGAFVRATDTPESLFARADAALYAAKSDGRATFRFG